MLDLRNHRSCWRRILLLAACLTVYSVSGCSEQQAEGVAARVDNSSTGPAEDDAKSQESTKPDSDESPPSTPDTGSEEPLSVEIAVDVPTNSNPVVAGAGIAPQQVQAGDTVVFEVRTRIAPGWHIYSVDKPTGVSRPTKLHLKLPAGVEATGDWEFSEPDASTSAGDVVFVYHGEVSFRHRLRIATDVPAGPLSIECRFDHQACTDKSCLPPASTGLVAEVVVAAPE